MKVLDLNCRLGHSFEGWFANEADYQQQRDREAIACPLCEDTQISKALAAPRLNLKTSKSSPNQEGQPQEGGVSAADRRELLRAWLELSRRVAGNAEDVGERFAQEARKIHYGEVDERSIRGQASAQEFQELLEEGVAVMPLLVPETGKGTLQ